MEERKYFMVSKINVDAFNGECESFVSRGFKPYGPPMIIPFEDNILFTQTFIKGFSSNKLLTTQTSSDNIPSDFFDSELFEED
ncbi:MAG: hypothetical protein KQ78_00458 [Candidatus Izimaplasma bacterium HR2]|nr:MAG: hypothetical protein KQ78_00458 [Candidatus Izimaplasma bacterium HR2]